MDLNGTYSQESGHKTKTSGVEDPPAFISYKLCPWCLWFQNDERQPVFVYVIHLKWE